MKKYFLLAVALSALLISCDTEDETLKKETANIPTAVVHAGKSSDQITIYKSCINNFSYSPLMAFEENIHAYEIHVNNYIKGEQKYETLNWEIFIQLQVTSFDIFQKLNYSDQFKIQLKRILNNQGFISDNSLLSQNEIILLDTLNSLQTEGNDGDLNKNRRTIAFAYGAQYSFKQAVLYAGAIELSNLR